MRQPIFGSASQPARSCCAGEPLESASPLQRHRCTPQGSPPAPQIIDTRLAFRLPPPAAPRGHDEMSPFARPADRLQATETIAFRLPSWMIWTILTGAALTLMILVSSAEPWRATRWAWRTPDMRSRIEQAGKLPHTASSSRAANKSSTPTVATADPAAASPVTLPRTLTTLLRPARSACKHACRSAHCSPAVTTTSDLALGRTGAPSQADSSPMHHTCLHRAP